MLLRLENTYNAMATSALEMERIANNLANGSTTGYKSNRTFAEAYNERIDHEGSPRSHRVRTQWVDHSQGSFEFTGNPLDLSLSGEGFFVVSDEETDTVRYTRAGHFLIDDAGTLRDPSGRQVEGLSGPIEFPPNWSDVKVLQTGEIVVDNEPVDTIRVVRFADPMRLERADGAAFLAPGQEPEEVDQPFVLQGQLETSNTDALTTMNDLIVNARLFESQQRMMQSIDDVLQRVSRDLSRF